MRIRVLWMLKLSVAAAIAYLILTIIPLSEVARQLGAADPFFVAIAWALFVVQLYISSWRLRLLTDHQGMSITTAQIAGITFTAQFYGLFLPGSLTAGALRWYRIAQVDGKKTAALVAIVVSRGIYTLALIALGVLFLIADGTVDSTVTTLALVGLLVCLLGLYVAVFNASAVGLARRMRRQTSGAWLTAFRTVLDRLITASEGFRALPSRVLAWTATLGLLENLVGMISVFLMAKAIAMEIGFASLAWARSAIQLATLFPISFAGIGIREGGFIVLLEPYGVPNEEAVTLGILVFSRLILIAVIGAILEGRLVFLSASGREAEVEGRQ
jgi:glycosyltransferase 2 family protein